MSEEFIDENGVVWQFPCDYGIKIMGQAREDFADDVVAVVQKYIPGNYTPQIKPSRNGKYLSVSVNFTLSNKPQLIDIYAEMKTIVGFKMSL